MSPADKVSYAGTSKGGWGVTLNCGHFHLVGKGPGMARRANEMVEQALAIRCYKCGGPGQ